MRAVADNVAFTRRHGNDVVVVVSAMGKATDNLIALAGQVSTTRRGREMDMLLTTGERVSAALAKALNADACEIYTDVTGVFSADPRIVPQARKLKRISFDEMLEMAGSCSTAIAPRSVE